MTGLLAPSGERFLPELCRIAELAVATAILTRERVTTAVTTAERTAVLAEYSREAARLAVEVAIGAPRALVPPIDGEDAAALAARLRHVVVVTRSAALLAGMMGSGPRVATHLADLLVETADSLEGGVVTLTDRTRAVDFARDVRRLARDGERVYIHAVGSLVATASAIDAVREYEICAAFRESFAACNAAATLVETIGLKRL